ncbi:DENN-domain-containing protein [Rhizoclosmatium globosum]|uniref:DENN-domain-containing protein n=1 Tax=Rhizoclosmatium globosum TaxID=329046 RepID=A0A1Y2B0S5_9FUNG|nr:DENN-domain-containing protein [Rhizoclosmatium globosum]|eukprot:ORY28412.1 DENN-domain-containing protein [Rhizoclosmatium globosum]
MTLPIRLCDYFFVAGFPPDGSTHVELLRSETFEKPHPKPIAKPKPSVQYESDDGGDSDTPLSLLAARLKPKNSELRRSNSAARFFGGLLHPSSRSRHASDVSNIEQDPGAMTPAQSKMKRTHPLEYKYSSKILQRFPEKDWSDRERFPENVHMFCFPNGLQFRHEPDTPPESTCHSFVVSSEQGDKSFGVCLTFYERIQEPVASQLEEIIDEWRQECIATTDLEYLQYLQSQLADNQERILKVNSNQFPDISLDEREDIRSDAEEKCALYRELIQGMEKVMPVDMENVYVPRCVGLVGRWPFYDVFGDWLKAVVRIVKGVENENGGNGGSGSLDEILGAGNKLNIPLERLLTNFLYEVPLPPPGRVEVKITVGRYNLFCSRPPVNSIQALQNFSLYPLFRALSVSNIVSIFEHAMTEKRILFLSSHYSMLTLACESIVLLLYPFTWQHHYVPILPAEGIKILQATMPFIIGVHKEYYYKADELDADWKTDLCIVDLDTNTLDSDNPPPQIPPRDRRKLIARLLKYTGAPPLPPSSSQKHKHPQTHPEPTPKGIPLQTRTAYPLGKLVPRTNVSRRWLAQVEADATAKDDADGMDEGEDDESVLSRRQSTKSLLQSHESISPTNTEPVPPLPVAQSHPEIPSGSRGSLDNIRQGIKFRFGIPVLRGKGVVLKTLSMDEGASVGVSSEPVQSSPPPLSPLPGAAASGVGSVDDDLRRFGEELRKGEDKSGSSILRAANAINSENPPKQFEDPTVVSAVSSNNTSGSRRVPVNYAPSITSSVTTGPTTYYDPSIKQSAPSIVESQISMSRPPQSRPFSPRSKGRHHGNQPKPTLTEGHAFTLIHFDPSTATTLSSNDDLLFSPQNTVAEEYNESESAELPATTGRPSNTSNQNTTPHNTFRRGSILNSLARTSKSIGNLAHVTSPTKRGSLSAVQPLKSPTGSESILSQKSGDSPTATAASSNQLVSSKAALNSGKHFMPWKGDSNDRPEDSLVCRLCLDPLGREGETTASALKCQYCKATIHTSCLPLIEGSPCITFFNEKKIQYSFFKVFTSLLKSYRQFLVMPEKLRLAKEQEGGGSSSEAANIVGLDLMPEDWFRKADFLASADRETRAYLTHIVETQNFVQFTLERVELPESDYEILFFDESIKAKLNRSKLKFSKETTPFLKDGAYSIRATITALAPNLDGLDQTKTYSTSLFPLIIDKSLLGTPRKANPLVTEADQNMMRSHTNELVNRTHMATTKRKQDFSKWMRMKLKNFQRPENRLNVKDLTEDERDKLFEEKVKGVNECIAGYESAHLASQTNAELQAAIEALHTQQYLLIDMTEAHLIDADNQGAYKSVTNRLLQVMTLYKEHLFALENPEYAHPRSVSAKRQFHADSPTLTRTASPDQMSIAASIPVSVRSRSESLRKPQQQQGSGGISAMPSPNTSTRAMRSPSAGLATEKKQLPPLPASPPIFEEHQPSSTPPQHPESPHSDDSSTPPATISDTPIQTQQRPVSSHILPPQVRPRSESMNSAESRKNHHHHSRHRSKSSQKSSAPPRSPASRLADDGTTSSIHSAEGRGSAAALPKYITRVDSTTSTTPPNGGGTESPAATGGGTRSPRKKSIAESIDSIVLKALGNSETGRSGDAIDEMAKAQEELEALVRSTRLSKGARRSSTGSIGSTETPPKAVVVGGVGGGSKFKHISEGDVVGLDASREADKLL